MSPEDMGDDIPLSDLRLKGRLHVEGVKAIRIDGKQFFGTLKMLDDSGDGFSVWKLKKTTWKSKSHG